MQSVPAADDAWSPDAGAPASQQLIVPGYHDLVLISPGGGGIVYCGRQASTGRMVAVKVFPLGIEPHELETAARLGRAHPHLTTVLDTPLSVDGRPCLVMDYHELGSLHDRLRHSGPLPVPSVISVGTVIADALGFAHAQGVLHRAVSPQHILVLPSAYTLSGCGTSRPTPQHASPQVLDGELPDITDDVYSLGSTLATLLGGRETTARIPADLAAVIGRCLSGQRAERFPDAASLRQALAEVQTEESTWAPDRPQRPAPQITAPPTVSATPTPPQPATPPPTVSATPTAPQPATPPPTASATPTPPQPTTPPPTASATASAPWHITAVAPGDARPAAPIDAPSPVVPLLAPTEPPRPVIPFVAPPPVEPPRPVVVTPAADAPLIQPPLLPVMLPTTLEPLTPPGLSRPAAPTTIEERPRSRRPNLLILAGVALLAGGLIGVGAAWIRSPGTPAATQPTVPAGTPVPSFSGAMPTPAGSARANDAAIAPTITTFLDKGTSFELAWADKSNGRAVFVVIEIAGANGVPLTQTAAGQTTVVIGGIDPKRPYCLAVLAVTDTGQALSPLRCTGTRP